MTAPYVTVRLPVVVVECRLDCARCRGTGFVACVQSGRHDEDCGCLRGRRLCRCQTVGGRCADHATEVVEDGWASLSARCAPCGGAA